MSQAHVESAGLARSIDRSIERESVRQRAQHLARSSPPIPGCLNPISLQPPEPDSPHFNICLPLPFSAVIAFASLVSFAFQYLILHVHSPLQLHRIAPRPFLSSTKLQTTVFRTDFGIYFHLAPPESVPLFVLLLVSQGKKHL